MNRLESLINRKERFNNYINAKINEEVTKQWSLDNDGVEVGDDFYMEHRFGKRKYLLVKLDYEHDYDYNWGVKPFFRLYTKDERRLNKRTEWDFFEPKTITRIGKCSEKIKELNKILEYNRRY